MEGSTEYVKKELIVKCPECKYKFIAPSTELIIWAEMKIRSFIFCPECHCKFSIDGDGALIVKKTKETDKIYEI